MRHTILQKFDTAHMNMANNTDGVDLVVPSHILKHRWKKVDL